MGKQKLIFVRRNGSSSTIAFIIMLILAAALSLMAAAAWQMKEQPDMQASAKMYTDLSETSSSDTVAMTSQPTAGASDLEDKKSPSNVSESLSGAGQPSSETGQSTSGTGESLSYEVHEGPFNFSSALGETPRVESTYFDDAVFVGDSLTTGIKLYDIMSNTTVLASTGVNLDSIFTKKSIDINGELITVMDALDKGSYKKIYIMLGANGAAYLTHRQIINRYGELIDSVKEHHANSIIYIQSILPINEAEYKTRYGGNLTNSKIDAINYSLLLLAAEKNVYYLDLASVFKDAEGQMPAGDTPDGIHINAACYTKWFDYLKTHTVEGEIK